MADSGASLAGKLTGHAKNGTQLLIVMADLGLFRTHHVAIQGGPNLCAKKLAAGQDGSAPLEHSTYRSADRSPIAMAEIAIVRAG